MLLPQKAIVALAQAAAERDAALRQETHPSATQPGLPPSQESQPKDDLDRLMDALDAVDL